ncbi:hypothetical protein ACN47E_000039 [Coniothyrium glycines]
MFDHHNSSQADPCIAYGRGGAGNMRRRSSIVSAWSKIASTSPPTSTKLVLTSSPEDHYARLSREDKRRASSAWSSSASTAGEKKNIWERLFKRRGSGAEEVGCEGAKRQGSRASVEVESVKTGASSEE